MTEMSPEVSPEESGKRRAQVTLALRFFLIATVALVLAFSYAMYRLVDNSNDTIKAVRATQKVSFKNVTTVKAQSEQIAQVLERVKSCTTPDAPCSRRGQQATAKAVVIIGKQNQASAAAAAACAISEPNPTFKNVYACVIRTTTKASTAAR